LLLTVAVIQAKTSRPVDDCLIARSNQLGLFNGNVLVIDHGGEIYRKAIGCADASRQVILADTGSIATKLNPAGS
jgi:hypothetical protein